MLVPILVSVSAALTLISYLDATYNSIRSEYCLQLIDVVQKNWFIGLEYNNLDNEDNTTRCLRIGLFFCCLMLITQKLPEEVLNDSPELKSISKAWWQKLLP